MHDDPMDMNWFGEDAPDYEPAVSVPEESFQFRLDLKTINGVGGYGAAWTHGLELAFDEAARRLLTTQTGRAVLDGQDYAFGRHWTHDNVDRAVGIFGDAAVFGD